jgi:hypothetical protein
MVFIGVFLRFFDRIKIRPHFIFLAAGNICRNLKPADCRRRA